MNATVVDRQFDHTVVLTTKHWTPFTPTQPIVGVSKQTLTISDRIARLSKGTSNVLVTGETGTGKDLVAQHLHAVSGRKGQFVRVNCSAIPETLIEAELFGHCRGAYTDAKMDKPGLFEAAEDGTILLDEIGEMPLAMQTRLLDVLQEGKTRRIGERTTRPVNARIITATNQNLEALVFERKFREDLYHRIAVVKIEVPPLRKRRDDILPLATHYLAYFTRGADRPRSFSDAAKEAMIQYDWPGNVRDLSNAIERAVAEFGDVEVLDREHLSLGGDRTPSWESFQAVRLPPNGMPLEEIERQAIREALRRSLGVQKDAAALLFISPRVINYKIKTLAIDVRDWRRWMRTS